MSYETTGVTLVLTNYKRVQAYPLWSLDSAAYTCMLVSYRRLSPLFQFSLSGVTLVYLSQWDGLIFSASSAL
jgi:hypothetical protein